MPQAEISEGSCETGTVFAYLYTAPGDPPDAEEKARAAIEAYTQKYLGGGKVAWCVDHLETRAADCPLSQRPQGSQFVGGLRRGDHIIFERIARSASRRTELERLLRIWISRGVIVHFVEFPPDAHISASDVGRAVVSALALAGAWRRSPNQRGPRRRPRRRRS